MALPSNPRLAATKRRTASGELFNSAQPAESTNSHVSREPVKRATSKRQNVELELHAWRRQWSEYMRRCHMYLDCFDESSAERVRPTLLKVGCKLDPFFSPVTTILVTKRPVDAEYPSSDIIMRARARDIKIWNYEKLLRFLNNLCGSLVPPGSYTASSASIPANSNVNTIRGGHPSTQDPSNSKSTLQNMLKEEQLYGSTDAGLNREDFYKFHGPYQLVWDPTHRYKPLHSIEFETPKTILEAEWPQLTPTGNGRSPFNAAEKGRAIQPMTVRPGTPLKPINTAVDPSSLSKTYNPIEDVVNRKRKQIDIISETCKRLTKNNIWGRDALAQTEIVQEETYEENSLGAETKPISLINIKKITPRRYLMGSAITNPEKGLSTDITEGQLGSLGPNPINVSAWNEEPKFVDDKENDIGEVSISSIHASGLNEYESKSVTTLPSGLSTATSMFSNLNSQPPGYGSGSASSHSIASSHNGSLTYSQKNMFSMKRRGNVGTPTPKSILDPGNKFANEPLKQPPKWNSRNSPSKPKSRDIPMNFASPSNNEPFASMNGSKSGLDLAQQSNGFYSNTKGRPATDDFNKKIRNGITEENEVGLKEEGKDEEDSDIVEISTTRSMGNPNSKHQNQSQVSKSAISNLANRSTKYNTTFSPNDSPLDKGVDADNKSLISPAHVLQRNSIVTPTRSKKDQATLKNMSISRLAIQSKSKLASNSNTNNTTSKTTTTTTTIPKKPVSLNPYRTDPALVPNHGIRRTGQAGHCENCHDYYKDFFEHVASEKHRSIARDETHWSQVDMLLEQLVRPARQCKDVFDYPSEDEEEEQKDEEGEEEEEKEMDANEVAWYAEECRLRIETPEY